MTVTVKTERTSKFLEPGLYVSWFAAGFAGLALILSWFLGNTVIKETVQVPPEDSVELTTLELKPRAIGATRINAVAQIPTNRWVTYELQLLDAEGNPIASALKQAWKESGTWYEDGESGTWQESDLRAGLDVQAQKDKEPVTLAIAVLEYTDTSGNPIEQAVPIRVNVQQGVVDGRYLWPGAIATLILAFLTGRAMKESGRLVLNKSIRDSDVGDRAVMGGKNNLLKLDIDIASDEHTPQTLRVQLWIRDGNGEEIYAKIYPVRPRRITEDIYKSEVVAYFQFPEKASYGFYVEVTPDGPIDLTSLKVFDRVRTSGSVEVVRIEPEV
ncbi:hypothetical protein [Baaleninema sp.]|uniref:hypothetical protein n=1 Tax=Baaleninema sp. TaxID=3101197 RepID=UPI003D046F8D